MNFSDAVTSLSEHLGGLYKEHLGNIEKPDFYKILYKATFHVPFVGTYRAVRRSWRLMPEVNDALSFVKDVYKLESEKEYKKIRGLRYHVVWDAASFILRYIQIQTLLRVLNSKSPLELAYHTSLFFVLAGAAASLEHKLIWNAEKELEELLSKKIKP